MSETERSISPAYTGVFRKLSDQECYRLLSAATVGQVAFVGSTGLQLLPLNFQVIDGILYFQVSADSVLAELAAGLDDVAFSVGYREELLQKGWSVVIKGRASSVNDKTVLEDVRAVARLRPWAPGDRSLIISLTPQSISGRKVSQH